MATEIKMPQLSDTMDSGKILSWNFKVGDLIDRGDILAEVETDKANLEIESFHKGTLLQIVTPANESADVGQIIAFQRKTHLVVHRVVQIEKTPPYKLTCQGDANWYTDEPVSLQNYIGLIDLKGRK